MMNIKVIALASAGLFLIMAPVTHLHVWGEAVTPTDKVVTDKAAAIPKDDKEITKDIKDEINSDKDFAKDTEKVDIKTVNGKVTLSGTVADEDTKADVEAVAKDYAGDNNVVNNIVVNEDK
jgi:osmotically-inducible protein OsmY